MTIGYVLLWLVFLVTGIFTVRLLNKRGFFVAQYVYLVAFVLFTCVLFAFLGRNLSGLWFSYLLPEDTLPIFLKIVVSPVSPLLPYLNIITMLITAVSVFIILSVFMLTADLVIRLVAKFGKSKKNPFRTRTNAVRRVFHTRACIISGREVLLFSCKLSC